MNCGADCCLSDEDMINKILKSLEDEGMLPPFNSWDYHMDGDNADESSKRYHSWEPEE
jgi:hypothetical protein